MVNRRLERLGWGKEALAETACRRRITAPHFIHSFFPENTLSAVFLCDASSSKMAQGSSRQTEKPVTSAVFRGSRRWGKGDGSSHSEAAAGRSEERTRSLCVVLEISRDQQRDRARVSRYLSRVQDAGACPLGDRKPVGGESSSSSGLTFLVRSENRRGIWPAVTIPRSAWARRSSHHGKSGAVQRCREGDGEVHG